MANIRETYTSKNAFHTTFVQNKQQTRAEEWESGRDYRGFAVENDDPDDLSLL